jgi:hypothetical protein
MFFTYHKQKYNLNKNNQINNLILIARNQLIEHNFYLFKLPIKNNKKKNINRYKYIRNKYLNKYSYMSINLSSLYLNSHF